MDTLKINSFLEENEKIVYNIEPKKAFPNLLLFLGAFVAAALSVFLGIHLGEVVFIVIFSIIAVLLLVFGVILMRNFFKAVSNGKLGSFILTDKKVYIYNKRLKDYDNFYLNELVSWDNFIIEEAGKPIVPYLFSESFNASIKFKIIFTTNKTYELVDLNALDFRKICKIFYTDYPDICKTPIADLKKQMDVKSKNKKN